MTILAAVGEDRYADVITIADDLARTYGDTLVVLHTIPEEEFDSYRESVRGIDEFKNFSITQEMDSAAQFARRAVTETLGEFDADRMRTRGRVGTPADEILSAADDVDPRFLVISGRRRSPTGKALFGSTTQQVLLNAETPVVTTMTE